MQVISPNNVKIYNLSAGKSLPEVSCSCFISFRFRVRSSHPSTTNVYDFT